MSVSDTELVGVVGPQGQVIHGVGAVRIPMRLSDSFRPANVTLLGATLPAKKPVPPSFKGTHVGQFAVPQDKTQPAWKWDGKQWLITPRDEAEKQIKAQGLKTGVATSKPVAPVASKPVAVAPPKPPTQTGRFVGEIFLPSNPAEHAWRWDGTVWRGISRSDAVKPTTPEVQAAAAAAAAKASAAVSAATIITNPASLFQKVIAAVAPQMAAAAVSPTASTASTGQTVKPPQPPARPGRFVGEIMLPSNPAEHAWRWDGTVWRGISRSDAVKPTTPQVQAAAAAAAAEAAKSPFDKLTDTLKSAAQSVGIIKPAPEPHPSVATVTPGSATPGYVATTAGEMKLPTLTDPDADGQTRPGRKAPLPTVGAAGTYPSTALDSNGDGINDRTGQPVQPPTVGVPGTFPSTALDANGDGIIDSTGAPAPAPILGQRGAFPPTPDDLNGDGLNDSTGKPLDANALHEAGLGGMLLPIGGALLAVLLLSGQKRGGNVRQWR